MFDYEKVDFRVVKTLSFCQEVSNLKKTGLKAEQGMILY
jgi:hypothetical protein